MYEGEQAAWRGREHCRPPRMPRRRRVRIFAPLTWHGHLARERSVMSCEVPQTITGKMPVPRSFATASLFMRSGKFLFPTIRRLPLLYVAGELNQAGDHLTNSRSTQLVQSAPFDPPHPLLT